MKVEKEALGGQRVEPTEEELALVNRQSRKELTAAEVYLFAVRLCDNEVDRDGEQFPQASSFIYTNTSLKDGAYI